jgi:hypothetical protein
MAHRARDSHTGSVLSDCPDTDCVTGCDQHFVCHPHSYSEHADLSGNCFEAVGSHHTGHSLSKRGRHFFNECSR